MSTISKQALKDADLLEVLQNQASTEREKQEAFNKLYNNHHKQLGLYFLKQTRDADNADDLKMITFEKVYRNIHLYNKETSVFSTWLYSIAKNTLIDCTRKYKLEVLSVDTLATKTADENEGMEFQIKSDAITPEQEMVREENVKAVHDAIESIGNERIRRLLRYRFIDELSFEEIAELEGVDPKNSTLRVNAMRGQEMLKELLANA